MIYNLARYSWTSQFWWDLTLEVQHFLRKHAYQSYLTHWGRVKHICISNLTIIGSDNGLSPGRHQAITWINVGILLIGPLGTNFREMLIAIHTFSFKKIHLNMSSGKWRPFCLSLNVLIPQHWDGIGSHQWPAVSTDKGPVMGRTYPCHDLIWIKL